MEATWARREAATGVKGRVAIVARREVAGPGVLDRLLACDQCV